MDRFTQHPREQTNTSRWFTSEHLETAKAYLADPDAFIRTLDVTINGKLRHLITYMPNEKGYALRLLHKAFVSCLQQRYRPSAASYAYMKKKNIVMCARSSTFRELSS